MITSQVSEFRDAYAADRFPARHAATAKALMLVSPEGFAISGETASDNVYMDLAHGADPERALAQHRELWRALDRTLPITQFKGSASTPDAVFCNNAYATVLGRLIVGAMRHAERRRETERTDIVDWFARRMAYPATRLASEPGVVAELTGPRVIDRARGMGFCGLTERCNEAGAQAMHRAFGLDATLSFALAPGEYHTNVVLMVLAGRAVVLHRASFADPEVAEAIAACYAPHVVWLSDEEKAAFCGNCIALGQGQVWMSARADAALGPEHRAILEHAGLSVRSVPLDELEKAGGSLRCCIGEIF